MQVIKKKTQKVVGVCFFLIFASLITVVTYNRSTSLKKYPSSKLAKNIKQADIVWTYNLTGFPEIYIDDTYEYNNWSNSADRLDWITGAGTEGNPYEIKNVLFDGEDRNINLITIKNSDAYFRIKDCILYNTYYYNWYEDTCNAIYLENVENGVISNVNASGCMNGIRLVDSERNRILGNFARDNYESGIVVSGGSKNIIRNNTINNQIGIELVDDTYNNEVLENSILGGQHDGKAIYLYKSYYNNITFNTISDYWEASGICLRQSDYNNVSGNTVCDSGIGLEILYSNNNYISANLVENSTLQWYAYDVFVEEHAFGGFGIHIIDSSWNTIRNNNIIDCQLLGFYIENSDNHSIRENTITNSGYDDIHLVNTPTINLSLNEMFGSGLYFNIHYSDLADINIEA